MALNADSLNSFVASLVAKTFHNVNGKVSLYDDLMEHFHRLAREGGIPFNHLDYSEITHQDFDVTFFEEEDSMRFSCVIGGGEGINRKATALSKCDINAMVTENANFEGLGVDISCASYIQHFADTLLRNLPILHESAYSNNQNVIDAVRLENDEGYFQDCLNKVTESIGIRDLVIGNERKVYHPPCTLIEPILPEGTLFGKNLESLLNLSVKNKRRNNKTSKVDDFWIIPFSALKVLIIPIRFRIDFAQGHHKKSIEGFFGGFVMPQPEHIFRITNFK